MEWRRELGNSAEAGVEQLFREQGYCILARNFTCRYGELDIVAERGEMVVFVEVRMRSRAAWGAPSATVSWSKQRKVVRTALEYLFRNSLHGKMARFDVVSVIGVGADARMEHIEAAFDAGM